MAKGSGSAGIRRAANGEELSRNMSNKPKDWKIRQLSDGTYYASVRGDYVGGRWDKDRWSSLGYVSGNTLQSISNAIGLDLLKLVKKG